MIQRNKFQKETGNIGDCVKNDKLYLKWLEDKADKLDKLKKENEQLKECLEWYGDEKNWYHGVIKDEIGGQKARDLLKLLKEQG